MLSLFKITFLNIFFSPEAKVDTANIEQAAFDAFISRIDSISILTSLQKRHFKKDHDVLFFSGVTELYSAMPYQINLICHKTDFIIIDSLNDYGQGKDSWIYPVKVSKKINCDLPFVVLEDKQNNHIRKTTDLRLLMSSRYHHNGFFYIKFVVVQDLFQTTWYYKLDSKGHILDIASTAGLN